MAALPPPRLRLWMEKHGHKVSANLGEQKLRDRAAEVSLETNDPLPTLGKLRLIDGKTGTSFDSPVTVGYGPVERACTLSSTR